MKEEVQLTTDILCRRLCVNQYHQQGSNYSVSNHVLYCSSNNSNQLTGKSYGSRMHIFTGQRKILEGIINMHACLPFGTAFKSIVQL